MNNNDTQNTATAAAPQGVKPHRQIKLGVDVHWSSAEGLGGRGSAEGVMF